MRFSTIITETANGKSIVLKDEAGASAEVYSFGALLNAFSIPVNGENKNVVDGFASTEEAKQEITNGFKSAKLAPFVCRLNHGQYSFNEKKYTIEKFFLPPHAIHGIIYDGVYEVLTTHADEQYASVGLRYKYEGSDAGYPFSFEMLVNWKLEAGNRLTVKSTVFHHNAFAIPFADGWHPYFKLGESIDNATLQFKSDTQVEFDETLLPTGKTIKDARFEKGALLKDIFLDNCFVLQQAGEDACVLQDEHIRLSIQPDASYPYLQVYTPPHRKSIAIENLSATPDAFNNKMGLLLIEPNKQVSFTTSYVLAAL
ncbi:MAG: aldose 1-epimerase [Bacteroidota bacterium]|nr:aldose 1-epimerase [Bacteroidota bacterium]